MGRFYTPVQPEYVDNFIYTPPWEMAAFATKRMEEPISNKLQILNLMNNVPIEFWDDYDKETVKEIKEGISSDVDEMVENLRQDVLNPRNRNAIGKYQSDLLQRFETGDIANVIKTARNKAELDKRLEKMTPYEQDMIRKNLIQKAAEESEGRGSKTKVFDPGTIYEHRNLDQEFIKEMLATGVIKPDYVETVEVSPGKYIHKVKEGVGGLTEEKLKNAFTTWVSSKEDLQSYHDFAKNIYGQNYFSETGELDWRAGSTLDKDLQTVLQAQYKDIKQDKDLTPNQVYRWEQEDKAAEKQALIAPTRTTDITPEDIADTYYEKDANGNTVERSLVGQRRGITVSYLKDRFGEKYFNEKILPRIEEDYGGSFSKFLTSVGQGNKPSYLGKSDSDIWNDLKERDKRLRFKASWDSFYQAYGEEPVNRAKILVNETANENNYKFSLGTSSGAGNASVVQKDFSEWMKDPSSVIKYANLPDGATIKSIQYTNNSAKPMALPTATPSGNVADYPTQIGLTIKYSTDDGDYVGYTTGYVQARTLTPAGDATTFY